MRPFIAHLARPLAALAITLVACDSAPAQTLDLDLARFGVVTVEKHGDAFALLGEDGDAVGRVEHRRERGHDVLDVELDGAVSRFEWNDAGEQLGLVCEDGTEMTDTCADGLDVGARVLASEGFEVPGLEVAPDELEFRSACEVVSTTAINCEVCLSRATTYATYSVWDGGSCTQGWLWASCTHTFCSRSSEMEMMLE
ncbi:MAG: hypothetical protein K1X88_06190 [Nannocystaceae bacterium]|nr:hypothetical protein [Nannocystaceae bacterium]